MCCPFHGVFHMYCSCYMNCSQALLLPFPFISNKMSTYRSVAANSGHRAFLEHLCFLNIHKNSTLWQLCVQYDAREDWCENVKYNYTSIGNTFQISETLLATHWKTNDIRWPSLVYILYIFLHIIISVAVTDVTFSKSEKSKRPEWEMIRFSFFLIYCSSNFLFVS